MRGILYYNFPVFDSAANGLREKGYEVISPADLDREHGCFDALMLAGAYYDWDIIPAGFDLDAAVLRDVQGIIDSDAIMMLKGWEASVGARAEKAVAEWLGRKVLYYEDI
jgi:hypothetical protein